MRMSCNGCRVLRKGCSDDCILRPCLQWVASSDSQAHATLFLAKFYGRSGLINLVEASPQHLRPSTFRSLLYEACGRIVNPVFGSVGLLSSGNWAQCQAAVDSVLVGSPIVQMLPFPSDASLPRSMTYTPKAYDIRHVSRDPNSPPEAKKVKNRSRLTKLNPQDEPTGQVHTGESWLKHLHNGDVVKYDESMLSVESVEGFLTNSILGSKIPGDGDEGELGLDLTLG